MKKELIKDFSPVIVFLFTAVAFISVAFIFFSENEKVIRAAITFLIYMIVFSISSALGVITRYKITKNEDYKINEDYEIMFYSTFGINSFGLMIFLIILFFSKNNALIIGAVLVYLTLIGATIRYMTGYVIRSKKSE